jgi:hypothetical protein
VYKMAMKRTLFVLTLVFLVVPAVAAAKGELTSVEVCGASGCRTVERPPQEVIRAGDGITEIAPAAEPYFTVRLTVEQHGVGSDSWQIFYLPGSSMLAFPDEHGVMVFEQLPRPAAAAFRSVARGVEPYPVPTVTGASVGGKPVADPASYLALFGLDGGADVYPAEPDFVPIVLSSTRPSPWTGAPYFLFSPSAGALMRAAEVIELPDSLADAIAARQSLAAAGTGNTGFDWPLVAIVLASAFGLAVAAARLMRRERRAATA